MGCFLHCFGLSTKRKRRKTLYKVLAGDQKYGNYEVLAATEKSIIPYEPRARDQDREKGDIKGKKEKKKVRFNLSLQIYEANPSSYRVLENGEEEENKNTSFELDGEGSAALMIRYPLNHRYHNCSYDGDEDDGIEESDIDDFDDDEGFDWDDDGSEESLENHGDGEECEENSGYKEDGVKNQKLVSPNDAEVKSNLSGRERSISKNSVLSPVENLTQWKAIKTKVTSSRNSRKENVPSEQNTSTVVVSNTSSKFSACVMESNDLQSKPLLQEIGVDASLSNWLVSPNYNVSATIRCQ